MVAGVKGNGVVVSDLFTFRYSLSSLMAKEKSVFVFCALSALVLFLLVIDQAVHARGA